MAPIPAEALEAVRAFCQTRSPADVADELRIEAEVDGHAVTIVERRAPWMDGMGWTTAPVARLRYTATRGDWTLQCRGADERWRRYDGRSPTSSVQPLLDEVDADPTGIFWG